MATSRDIYAFRSQFAEFETVSDGDIAVALNTASLWVDSTKWSTTDFPQALLFWAAHFLSLKQMQLASVEFGGTGASDIYIRSISFGERHVVFNERKDAQSEADKMLGQGESMLLDTIYGQLFVQLRSRNIFPIAII